MKMARAPSSSRPVPFVGGSAAGDQPWLRAAICAGLLLATLLLFSRAIGHDFVNYDDPDYVTENARVQAGLSATGVGWAMGAGVASNWHPLTWMSHMADVSLFGLNPRGHHATSVLLHAVNAALAFLALRRLSGAVWPSVLCAALFAWHPLRVESVAWVAERKDVLSGFFGLLVLWAYAGYVERRRSGGGAAWRPYALALVAFALGLMAKPMLVTLPCVLLLLDFWPLRRIAVAPPAENSSPASGGKPESLVRVIVEKLPFFALVAVSSYVTYRVQAAGGSVSSALSLDARLANAVVAVVRYVGKFFWPADLAVLYPHPGTWPVAGVVTCAVIVAALTALAAWQFHSRPWLAVGWLWFLGMLVPVIGLVQVGLQSMADRYTYLPMLGVTLALVWTVRELMPSPGARRWLGVAAALALAGCAVQTWRQLGVWQNSFTLFDQAIAVTKDNYLAHDNRGLFLFKAGQFDEAMADYRRALAINPGYVNANNNLGHALAERGRPAEAIPFYRTALKSAPGRLELEVRNNLANALSDLNQLTEAMEHYEFVLARQPDHANALNGSAVALAMQNRLPEARARLERSLRIAPENPSAHNNLGNVCAMLGLRDAAVRHYRRAAELKPGDDFGFLQAGALLLQQEKFAEAVESFQRALALRPVNPDAHANLGLALARLGRRDEALRALRTALQQQPDHAQARAWLQQIESSK